MMTTNYTRIINENLDMFDVSEDDSIIVTRDRYFTIINPVDFNGNLDGLCNGWRIEYQKDGEIELGSNHFVYGYIEDEIEKWEKMGWEFPSIQSAKLNGWNPTGRVFFNGYFEESIEFIEEEGKYETVYNEA